MTEEKNCNNKVYLYNAKNTNRYFFYPNIELEQLENALEKKNIAEIQEIISTIAFELERAVYKDFIGKTACYEVANLCIRAFEGKEEYRDCGNILGQFALKLNNTNARKDFCILLQRLGEELGQAMSAKDPSACLPSQAETLSGQILDYIHSNYTNPSFYLGEVAEKFHLSQNNLSQQLKRILGVSPAKYINNLRLEQAKNLLIHTEDPVKQIAAKVGFTDDSSFIRKFKGMTSLTPNQYRATYQGKKK